MVFGKKQYTHFIPPSVISFGVVKIIVIANTLKIIVWKRWRQLIFHVINFGIVVFRCTLRAP